MAANRAEVLIQQGRIDEADSVLVPAIRVLLAADATSYLAFCVALYGRTALARGDYANALDRFAEARHHCLEMGEADEALSIQAWSAECLLRAGAVDDALQLVEQTRTTAARGGDAGLIEPHLLRVRGEALLHLGRTDEGHAALRTALDAAREHDTAIEIEAALRALLRLDAAATREERDRWLGEQGVLVEQLGIQVS